MMESVCSAGSDAEARQAATTPPGTSRQEAGRRPRTAEKGRFPFCCARLNELHRLRGCGWVWWRGEGWKKGARGPARICWACASKPHAPPLHKYRVQERTALVYDTCNACGLVGRGKGSGGGVGCIKSRSPRTLFCSSCPSRDWDFRNCEQVLAYIRGVRSFLTALTAGKLTQARVPG
ncbi:hypothetical protein J3F83DRAFT_499469 [Trichoderma novae-zelandiae]